METINRAIEIAERFNLWIKYVGVWYTPNWFSYKFQGQIFDDAGKRRIEFYNPEEELNTGFHMIVKWIREREDPEKIVKGLLKMRRFQEDIHRHYKSAGWTVDLVNKNTVVEEYYNSGAPDRIQYVIQKGEHNIK